jgi:ABC-type branched-subunit amino acid transport system ATPase component
MRSLNIYLDDSADSDLWITYLTNAGYGVISPRGAGTSGLSDSKHLEYAATHGYVLLTRNPDDFKTEHQNWQAQGRAHAGIFLVYQDNNVIKDMKATDVVRAIANLLASGIPIANEIYTLNQWR